MGAGLRRDDGEGESVGAGSRSRLKALLQWNRSDWNSNGSLAVGESKLCSGCWIAPRMDIRQREQQSH